MLFECVICSRQVTTKTNLTRHLRTIHQQKVDSSSMISPKVGGKNVFMCFLCETQFAKNIEYCKHLEDVHELVIKVEKKMFKSLEDFHEWKSKVEKECRSSFVAKSGDIVRGNTKHKYLGCCRSGSYTSQAVKRSPRVQGTKKIGFRCPAFMNIKKSQLDGSVEIKYSLSHQGHSNDLRYLNIPREEKKKIAADLALHIPEGEFLEKNMQ